MTRTQETGMAIIVTAVIIILLLLTSCGTRKTVTEYVYTHDTIVTHRTDTIRDVVYQVRTDTIRETIIREITIRQDSTGKHDTIRINTVNDHYRYVYEGDSSASYRSAVDSILSAIHQTKQKEVVKTKPLIPLWQKGLFLAVVFIVCIIILKSRTK